MTKDASCAHIAQYCDSKLLDQPRPCAGTVGTTIIFEDLFYNMATRRQALSKHNVEAAKILEVMQKYALHFPSVSMTCKKDQSKIAELHSPGGSSTTTLDVVNAVYG